MTDKELLELAAKAAGVEYTSVTELSGRLMGCHLPDAVFVKTGKVHWNPLTDDGDALRLAVKLGMSMDLLRPNTFVQRDTGRETEYVEAQEDHNNDPYAATRRAIVRAATEIGAGKTGENNASN
jgi:hypothetical protein